MKLTSLLSLSLGAGVYGSPPHPAVGKAFVDPSFNGSDLTLFADNRCHSLHAPFDLTVSSLELRMPATCSFFTMYNCSDYQIDIDLVYAFLIMGPNHMPSLPYPMDNAFRSFWCGPGAKGSAPHFNATAAPFGPVVTHP